jgi:hypothetical protein
METLHFAHIPSRDLDGDTVVNFADFALLARHWGSPSACSADGYGAASDLDSDAWTGLADLAGFTEYWLERTDCRPEE